jgi:hypothetical protein
MLSREDKTQRSPQEIAIAYAEASRAAKRLGQQLVLGERNENPHPERNLENPAHSGVTRIRLIRPQPTTVWADDIENVRDHNSYVGSLGREGTKFSS